jgi:hypothetical protein
MRPARLTPVVPCASAAGDPDWLLDSSEFSEKVTVETVTFFALRALAPGWPIQGKGHALIHSS